MSAPDPLLYETERLRVRILRPGDEPDLQAVFEDAGDYFLPITGRAEADPDAAEREIAATRSAPGRRVALVELQGAGDAVGALGWWQGHPEPDTALLGMLLVIPAVRGRGVGREALAGLEAHLRAQGIARIRTGVGAGDTTRHDLLRALGFQPLDQRRHVSVDRGRVMIALFEKVIGHRSSVVGPTDDG